MPLDSPFNFDIFGISVNWNAHLKLFLLLLMPDNTNLLYSLAVILIVILPGIPFSQSY